MQWQSPVSRHVNLAHFQRSLHSQAPSLMPARLPTLKVAAAYAPAPLFRPPDGLGYGASNHQCYIDVIVL